MSTSVTTVIKSVAREVKALHDRDEELTQARRHNKVEQRDVRLKIGELINGVSSSSETLEFISDQSGYPVARLQDFARVRAAWPENSYPADLSYTPLEELARDPDRFTKVQAGMSKRDARAAKGGKVDTPSRWSPQVKAQFIKEALENPEVASMVTSVQANRAALAEAEMDHVRQRREAETPGRKRQRETTELAEFTVRLDNIRYSIASAVDQAISLGAAGNSDVADVVSEIKNAVGWLDSYVNGGSTSFESELAQLLEGTYMLSATYLNGDRIYGLLLAHPNGLTHRQIQHKLGLSPSQVEGGLRRIRETIADRETNPITCIRNVYALAATERDALRYTRYRIALLHRWALNLTTSTVSPAARKFASPTLSMVEHQMGMLSSTLEYAEKTLAPVAP